MCESVKHTPCKPLVIPGRTNAAALLQEWHIKLGHIHKDILIKMMSDQLVKGMPKLSKKACKGIPFFCQTCAEMKMRRMSFRNTIGMRDKRPVSTVHMDTNGPMKLLGIYGTIANAKYFVTVIDDNSSKR